MVVGAYAVGVHGRPRATKDLDVWVEASAENAPKVVRARREFGAPLMGLTQKDLETPEAGLQIGREPLRIDVLTKISGPTFAEAWPTRTYADFGEGVRCPVIGIDALIANKRAAARPQDLADVAARENPREDVEVSRRRWRHMHCRRALTTRASIAAIPGRTSKAPRACRSSTLRRA